MGRSHLGNFLCRSLLLLRLLLHLLLYWLRTLIIDLILDQNDLMRLMCATLRSVDAILAEVDIVTSLAAVVGPREILIATIATVASAVVRAFLVNSHIGLRNFGPRLSLALKWRRWVTSRAVLRRL